MAGNGLNGGGELVEFARANDRGIVVDGKGVTGEADVYGDEGGIDVAGSYEMDLADDGEMGVRGIVGGTHSSLVSGGRIDRQVSTGSRFFRKTPLFTPAQVIIMARQMHQAGTSPDEIRGHVTSLCESVRIGAKGGRGKTRIFDAVEAMFEEGTAGNA